MGAFARGSVIEDSSASLAETIEPMPPPVTSAARVQPLRHALPPKPLTGAALYNPRSNSSQINPNKRKENGFHLFSFIFFCSLESGLFKGLRSKKIKNSLLLSTRAPGCE
jgi:hypothetical protein